MTKKYEKSRETPGVLIHFIMSKMFFFLGKLHNFALNLFFIVQANNNNNKKKHFSFDYTGFLLSITTKHK